MAYEWLGDVLLGAVAHFGGLVGLEVLLFGLASAVMVALYAYSTLRSGNSKAGFVSSGVLCSLAFASFNLRPQMIGYLFLVFTLIALERFRQGKEGTLWLLPLMFVLWVNIHGSFIIGVGVLLVYLLAGLRESHLGSIAAERWTAAQRVRLEMVLLLSIAVLPLTPYGARVAVYPFDMAFGQPVNVANILEWQSMPFGITGGKLFLALLVAFLVGQMLWRFSWGLAEIVLFCGGIVMACLHVRFLMLFVPFGAPIFAVMLARWLPAYDQKKDHPVLNALLMIGVTIAMARYFPTRGGLNKIVSEGYPVRAIEYLRQHPVPGPMFNTYGYGGYLIETYPEQKVFIDGRGDLYERAGIFGEYLEVANIKPAAFQVLRVHGIRSCLLESKEPLAVVLAAQPEWEKRYADGVSILFVRRTLTPGQATESKQVNRDSEK
jgi:hypothetical protein